MLRESGLVRKITAVSKNETGAFTVCATTRYRSVMRLAVGDDDRIVPEDEPNPAREFRHHASDHRHRRGTMGTLEVAVFDQGHPGAGRAPHGIIRDRRLRQGGYAVAAAGLSWSPTGRLRIRLPLAAKIALQSAAPMGGTPGSPTPPGGAVLGTT